MYHILVAGAGYTGSRIASFFREKKQKVWALTRSGSRNSEFEEKGIIPVTADLTLPVTLEKVPPAHFIVLSPAPDGHEPEDYRRVYLAGIHNFLDSLKAKPRPYLIVYISSTSVWKEREGAWVDESVEPDAESEKSRILAEAERHVLGCGLPSVVFRLSGIYGPGRNRLQAFRSGTWPGSAPAQDGWMNMIRVEDIVRAMPVLFKSAKAGEVYTGSDGSPVLRSEFCSWLAQKTGSSRDFKFFGPAGGKKCSSQKLKDLGFQFLYPDFRAGYEEFLKKD